MRTQQPLSDLPTTLSTAPYGKKIKKINLKKKGSKETLPYLILIFSSRFKLTIAEKRVVEMSLKMMQRMMVAMMKPGW